MKSNIQKIDHVVVLMLENRSFDNMLGWLMHPDSKKQKVNGVVGKKKLKNPIPPYVERPDGVTTVSVGIETKMTNPNPDPGEEYAHVNTQLFGQVLPEANLYKPFDTPPYNLPKRKSYTNAPMNGFVTDYISNFNAIRKRMPTYEEYAVVMGCHPEESVPVLSALAKEYAVFDAWFASVPSQTLCNRSFMHAATSHGFVLNSPFFHWLMHSSPTIFNRLEDKDDPFVTWRIYYDQQDMVSLTGLQNPALWKYRHSNFRYIENFFEDARTGNLPSYSFIEPRFFINHNDQHPPVGMQILETSSVLAGEELLKDVYYAVRDGANWENTLLIITYDEHGGCYDHVSPPAAKPPDPSRPIGEQGFSFDRLGVRVPTVMVSPYIKKGTVISDVHDHTSILKFIETRWGLKPLTDRDGNAGDISNVLNLRTPRRDNPEILHRHYEISEKACEAPLNDLQKTVIMIMAGFNDTLKIEHDGDIYKKARDILNLIEQEHRISHIKTVGQAIDYTMGFDKPVEKKPSFWTWLWEKLERLFR